MVKDSPSQTMEREEPSPGEDTMDLSWKGGVPKVRKEEEQREEGEEPSRQTDLEEEEEEEEEERDDSESGGPEAAECLVKKEREDDGENKKIDDHEMDGQAMDSQAMDGEDAAEKEDDSVDYGVEDMFIDTQDSPINYAKYDSPMPTDGGALTGWNGSQRTSQGSKFTCDICGLACVSLNVLLVHKRSHTGERPFHCQQCGASFTQKGNLLRHIKLHSGEKPFKCPMCSYACRRRDALSGHLRTHSVEKPYKCTHCGRSYKQRSSLEEHRERCHVYTQSKNDSERGCEEVSGNEARPQGGVERAILLDRLASNVAKRKSTMPQKFVGEAPVCLDLCFKREPGVHQSSSDHSQSSSVHEGLSGTPPDGEQPPHKSFPLHLTTSTASTPLALTNGSKMDRGLSLLSQPTAPPGHLTLDSPHSDGASRPRHASDPHRGSLLHHHQQQQQQQLPFSLGHLFVPPANGGLPFPLHVHPPLHPHAPLVHAPLPPHGVPPHEVLRVVQGSKGEPTGAYMCAHCRVLFLDYVMFTIHMGCHGFRDPLECNVCGHVSRDRYEFSSHIARGEHYLEIK